MDEWVGEVLIVGGGPVGLLLGNLLGQQGIRCAVVEQRTTPLLESRAIGIMPPSLCILRHLHLDRTFVDAGVRVDTARVHDERGFLGQVDFGGLRGGYPFILSLPQAQTVRLLEENLGRFSSVQHRMGTSVVGVRQSKQDVAVRLRCGIETTWRASVVVGCDGIRSAVRRLVHIPSVEKPYGTSFLMGDFEDHSGLNAEAHLFFTPHGSVESFPLPNGLRRWIVLTERYFPDADRGFLVHRVRDLSGYELRHSKQIWQSAFTTRRLFCRHYARRRVVLCGDAAHVMSPIGGQGMNTGFADAALLASALVAALRHGASLPAVFAQYAYVRRRAYRAAMRRAEWGMWLGTRTGHLASRLRSLFIKDVLLRPPVVHRLPNHFAMWTIPAWPGRIWPEKENGHETCGACETVCADA